MSAGYFMTKEEEFRLNRKKLLEKFGPEWVQKMNYSALAHNVFATLHKGADPYLLIESLIEMIEKQNSEMFEIIKRFPPRINF